MIRKMGLLGLFFILLTSPIIAEMEVSKTSHVIWGNVPVMYIIDLIIIVSSIGAIYYGSMLLGSELKSAFNFIFIGVLLIALVYLADLFSMITDNMMMMEFIHLDLLWVINAVCFIMFLIGFYNLNKIFAKVVKR